MCVLKAIPATPELNHWRVNKLSTKKVIHNQYAQNFNAFNLKFCHHPRRRRASVWSVKFQRELRSSSRCRSLTICIPSVAFHCCWWRSFHRCQLSQRYTSTARWDCVRAEIKSQCLRPLSPPESDSRIQKFNVNIKGGGGITTAATSTTTTEKQHCNCRSWQNKSLLQ